MYSVIHFCSPQNQINYSSSLSLWLCLSRLVVVAVLHSLPERPRGRDQGLRRGQADEGAAEERAAGPGRQGCRREQPQPQQRTLRQGRRL